MLFYLPLLQKIKERIISLQVFIKIIQKETNGHKREKYPCTIFIKIINIFCKCLCVPLLKMRLKTSQPFMKICYSKIPKRILVCDSSFYFKRQVTINEKNHIFHQFIIILLIRSPLVIPRISHRNIVITKVNLNHSIKCPLTCSLSKRSYLFMILPSI